MKRNRTFGFPNAWSSKPSGNPNVAPRPWTAACARLWSSVSWT